MAILPQRSLFRWEEVEDLRDLERLHLVLKYLPDERLMRRLEADRGQGRDDYPIRAVWNSLWFGYKLHLVVDALYELPVAFEMTPASASEMPQAHTLLERLKERHPQVLEACQAWTADKGYDDTKMITRLWDDHGILPAIDIKHMWKEPDQTRLLAGRRRIVYDQDGQVYCHCPKTGERRRMAYGGFEADRETQKFRCPAAHYGLECPGRAACEVQGAVRVPLVLDRRLFTPLARASYAWKRTYKHRTVVERVNSRLDVSLGFERHFIRGRSPDAPLPPPALPCRPQPRCKTATTQMARSEKPLTPYRLGMYKCGRNGFPAVPADDRVRNSCRCSARA